MCQTDTFSTQFNVRVGTFGCLLAAVPWRGVTGCMWGIDTGSGIDPTELTDTSHPTVLSFWTHLCVAAVFQIHNAGRRRLPLVLVRRKDPPLLVPRKDLVWARTELHRHTPPSGKHLASLAFLVGRAYVCVCVCVVCVRACVRARVRARARLRLHLSGFRKAFSLAFARRFVLGA